MLVMVFRGGVSEKIKVMDRKKNHLLSDCHGAKAPSWTVWHFEDLSICLRFFNFKIQNLLLFRAQALNSSNCKKQKNSYIRFLWSLDGTKLQILQRFNKLYVQPDKADSGWRLTPLEWHAFCFTYDKEKKQSKVLIDAQIVLEDNWDFNDKTLLSQTFDYNITFMPSYHKFNEWGSVDRMTDINIWNSTLEEETIEDWTKCKSNLDEFKVVDWKSTEWETQDLNINQVSKETICQGNNKSLTYKFNVSNNFFESVDFCHLLGGQLFVADTKEALKKLDSMCVTFAGLNDLGAEGVFINPYTKENIDKSLWATSEPNNYGGEDCTRLDDSLLLNDIPCNELHQCTLCNLHRNPQFELRGFCSTQDLDLRYQIIIDQFFDGVYDLHGWRRTDLTWNSHKSRWEIVNANDKTVLAFCNFTAKAKYPFGVQRYVRECSGNYVRTLGVTGV